MRAPKGFGKRYFTLGAIQAYAGTMTLRRSESSMHAHHLQVSDECDGEEAVEEEDPFLQEIQAPELSGPGHRRPCHCSRLFHRRACAALRNHPRAKSSVSPYRYMHATLAPPRTLQTMTDQPITRIKETR